MVKIRTRNPADYQPEAVRFEEWLMLNYNQSTGQIQNLNELIARVEEWLSSIDVYGHTQGEFAKSLLGYLLAQNMIPTSRPKEIQIVKDFLVSRTGRIWLKSEEGHLARLYQKKNVTTGYIARELGRSKNSIYRKASRLGIRRPKGALTKRDVKRRKALERASQGS